jgi:hypothetical protein
MSSEGKRPIFVDGRPVLQGNKVKLNHNSVIEVSIDPIKVLLLSIRNRKYSN